MTQWNPKFDLISEKDQEVSVQYDDATKFVKLPKGWRITIYEPQTSYADKVTTLASVAMIFIFGLTGIISLVMHRIF